MNNCGGAFGSKACSCLSFLAGKGTFIISVAVLALFVLNSAFAAANRSFQGEIVAGQQALNGKNQKLAQNRAFGNVYQALVQALANAATTKKDEAIRGLLVQNDIRIEPPPPQPAAAPAKK